MSSRSVTLLPVLVAAALVTAVPRASRAQNPGDAITVRSGSYLSPTATRTYAGFLNSWNCYSWTMPAYQGCQVDNLQYSASMFLSSVGESQAIQISSFDFFSAESSGGTNKVANQFNVYMGIAGGPLTLFGTFGGYRPGNRPCNSAPTVTCTPEVYTGTGSFLYNPALGDLQIKMVEFRELSGGGGCCVWYDQGQRVAQFQGTIVATPEPSTMLLLGSGLAAVFGVARRRSRRDSLAS